MHPPQNPKHKATTQTHTLERPMGRKCVTRRAAAAAGDEFACSPQHRLLLAFSLGAVLHRANVALLEIIELVFAHICGRPLAALERLVPFVEALVVRGLHLRTLWWARAHSARGADWTRRLGVSHEVIGSSYTSSTTMPVRL